MGGVNHVILACFLVAMHQNTYTRGLSVAVQQDCKLAIQCVHAISNFGLMVTYWSHTRETFG